MELILVVAGKGRELGSIPTLAFQFRPTRAGDVCSETEEEPRFGRPAGELRGSKHVRCGLMEKVVHSWKEWLLTRRCNMKRCSLLVALIVVGLCSVSWGNFLGLGCFNPCVGIGPIPCWNPTPCPVPPPCPRPRPCPCPVPPPCPEPEPCPTPCPPPCPQPNPCPTPCPRPCGLDIGGGTYFRVGTNFSAYNFGCGPCIPGPIVSQ